MKRMIYLLSIVFVFILLFSSCNSNTGDDQPIITKIASYGGSDPKGDYIGVKIDREKKTVTHYNYTLGQTNGPYTYSKVTSATESFGFDIIYKANINEGDVGYVLFAEFQNAAVIFQLFKNDGTPFGNPQYAITRSKIEKSQISEKAYNWMKFSIDPDGSTDIDMEAGFAAWDTWDGSTNLGTLYGAGFSKKSEFYNWGSNGINDINNGDVAKVDKFTYEASTDSSYFTIGGTGVLDRVYMIGTPSGSNILDFGPNTGGGSGLAIPQAQDKSMKSDYEGTYFIMLYEYSSWDDSDDGVSGNGTSIKPMKCIISGTTLKLFNASASTTTTPLVQLTLTPVSDLNATMSPGGAEALIAQFANISGNQSATSNSVKTAHQCFGSFIAAGDSGANTELTVIMFDPSGKFAGFSGFTEAKDGSGYALRFGFAIKDPNYSNTGL